MSVAQVAPDLAANPARTDATQPGEPRRRRGLPVTWPLTALILGLPLWWLIGIARFMPIALALVMLAQLWRRRVVALPAGFGWWLVFLVWVGLGIFVLTANAPGAVPGGGGFSRLVVWGFTLATYLSATVALIWMANLREDELTFADLARTVGWLFVFSTVGGLLGVFAAQVELRSLLELVLPRGFTSNSFVRSLIHPGLADIQSVLGRPEARPKAPFPYANTWGSVIALSLPFFLVGWVKYGTRRHRLAAPVVLALSMIPIVYSLNRGLWACLAVGVVFYVVLQIRKGRIGALLVASAALVAGVAIFMATPLSTIVGERFENQHSNDRRGQLLVETVESAVNGSPIVGFGGTRDVQGSFASIAGGATPDCPACRVPPLGTQGQLWMVMFSQGVVGAVFFVCFFIAALWRSSGLSTLPEAMAFCLVLFFLIQIFIYDTGGMPMLIVMLGIAAGWREWRTRHSERRVDTVRSLAADIARRRVLIAVLALLGIVGGAGVAMLTPPYYLVRGYILLTNPPSYLQTEVDDSEPRQTTIDTEAALVVSRQTLERVDPDPAVQAEIRDGLQITAIPNTQVLLITLQSGDPSDMEERVALIAESYLDTRRLYLEVRRSQVLADLYDQLAEVVSLGVSESNTDRSQLEQAVFNTLVTPTSAGETIRIAGPWQGTREFGKQVGTGLAIGLLVAAAIVGYRPRRD